MLDRPGFRPGCPAIRLQEVALEAETIWGNGQG